MMEWDLGDKIGYAIPGTGYWEERKQPAPEKEKPKKRGSRDRDASKKAPKKSGKK